MWAVDCPWVSISRPTSTVDVMLNRPMFTWVYPLMGCVPEFNEPEQEAYA